MHFYSRHETKKIEIITYLLQFKNIREWWHHIVENWNIFLELCLTEDFLKRRKITRGESMILLSKKRTTKISSTSIIIDVPKKNKSSLTSFYLCRGGEEKINKKQFNSFEIQCAGEVRRKIKRELSLNRLWSQVLTDCAWFRSELFLDVCIATFITWKSLRRYLDLDLDDYRKNVACSLRIIIRKEKRLLAFFKSISIYNYRSYLFRIATYELGSSYFKNPSKKISKLFRLSVK